MISYRHPSLCLPTILDKSSHTIELQAGHWSPIITFIFVTPLKTVSSQRHHHRLEAADMHFSNAIAIAILSLAASSAAFTESSYRLQARDAYPLADSDVYYEKRDFEERDFDERDFYERDLYERDLDEFDLYERDFEEGDLYARYASPLKNNPGLKIPADHWAAATAHHSTGGEQIPINHSPGRSHPESPGRNSYVSQNDLHGLHADNAMAGNSHLNHDLKGHMHRKRAIMELLAERDEDSYYGW